MSQEACTLIEFCVEEEGLMEVVLTTGESGQELKVSPDSIRRYEKDGVLPVAFKTRRGLRLFRASDVEKLRRKRAARENEAQLAQAAVNA